MKQPRDDSIYRYSVYSKSSQTIPGCAIVNGQSKQDLIFRQNFQGRIRNYFILKVCLFPMYSSSARTEYSQTENIALRPRGYRQTNMNT